MGGIAPIILLAQLLFSAGSVAVDTAVGVVSFAALGLGLGGTLAWQSAGALAKRDSPQFDPPSVWLLAAAYILTLILGQAIISLDLVPVLFFPPFHVAAAALPPFIILAFAGRTLKATRVSRREVALQLSGGAFLSTTLAFVAEIVIGGLFLLFAVIATALTPGGRAIIEELLVNLQDPAWLQNPANVQEIILFPPVLFTAVLVFVVLAPLIEEAAKLMPVTFFSYRRPAVAQIFIWGLASGAGFALVENLFNTLIAVDIWAVVMLMRIGGTAMHCLATGLTAMGWQNLMQERRPWKLGGAYILSVAIHAAWNGTVIGIAGLSLVATEAAGDPALLFTGVGAIILLAWLGLMTVAIAAAIVFVTYRLKVTESPVSTPAAT
jgi:RsiW-degrading membrane proteinase PrsW (M82 family)